MSSPEIHRSVSYQILANSHFSGSGSHHNHSHKKPSSSRNLVGNPRILSKNNVYSNMVEQCGSSPYYKGLTDQSLAIYETAQAQLPSSSSDYNCNRHPSNVPSRYYRGLTDYTLAISGKQLASGGSYHELDYSYHSGGSLPCECSMYYKGLLDYTLALSGQGLASHGSSASPGVDTNPNVTNIVPLNPLTLGFTELNLEPGYSSSSSAKGKTDDSNWTVLERKEVNHDLGYVIGEKPLGERVSEPCMVGKVEEEETTEKPLRECISVSEQEYTWENEEKALQLQELKVVDTPAQREHPHVTPESIPENDSEDVVSSPMKDVDGDDNVTNEPAPEDQPSLHACNETLFGTTTTYGTSSRAPEPSSPRVDAPELVTRAAPFSSLVTSTEMVSPLAMASAFFKPSTATANPGDIEAALSQLVNENYLSSAQAAELKSFLNAHPSMFIPVSSIRNLRQLGWAYSCLLDLLPLISRCKEFNITEDEGNKLLEVLDDMLSFPFDKDWVKAADKYVTSVLVFVKDHWPALSKAYDQIEVAHKEVLAMQQEITAKKAEKAVVEAHLERIREELEALSQKMMAAEAVEAAATEIKEELLKTIPAPFI